MANPDDTPAGDLLGEVRELLDGLAPAAAPPDLARSTIEMAAVTSAAVDAPAATVGRVPTRGWWPAAACVGAALLLGFAAGRATSPDPDESILQYLPVVEHLDVLREAGSIDFLDAIATRGYPAPRAFPFGPGSVRDAEGGDRDDWPQLDAAIEALRAGPFGPETPAAAISERRDRIEEMDDDELRHLADGVTIFRGLPREATHDLIGLARALCESDDERLETLAAAASAWHRWVVWSDPADRQAVVNLDRDDRLEWLDRRSRGPNRPSWPAGRGFSGRERGGRETPPAPR